MERTPGRITPLILKFCEKIEPSQTPFYVPLRPESWCVVNDCFPNVRQKVERDKGDIQFGWSIWEQPGIMLEAEFHSIWVSLQKEFIDITPKEIPTISILFLPDPTQSYDYSSRKRIDNIRMPLSTKPVVLEYIKLSKEFYSRMEENTVGRYIVMQRSQQEPLGLKLKEVMEQLDANKLGGNALCPCGSKRKYKKCCG